MVHKDIQNFRIVIIELPHIKMHQLLSVCILFSFFIQGTLLHLKTITDNSDQYYPQ